LIIGVFYRRIENTHNSSEIEIVETSVHAKIATNKQTKLKQQK